MNIEQFREYCLNKKGVTESFPFGEDTLVFKVMGKIFALSGLNEDFRINLKCDPEIAIDLREHYPAVLPGYHMNKMHWNTIVVDGSVADELLMKWIDHSYDLIVDSLNRKLKSDYDSL